MPRIKKLVVATDTASVPFEFKQGDKYVGFDVDPWAAIAKELKLDYELEADGFQWDHSGTANQNDRSGAGGHYHHRRA